MLSIENIPRSIACLVARRYTAEGHGCPWADGQVWATGPPYCLSGTVEDLRFVLFPLKLFLPRTFLN